MSPDYYTRAESDSKLECLRQEIRADINGLRAEMNDRFGAMEAKFEGRFGALEAKFEGLRGEVKVWLLVLTIVVTPLVSTLMTRVSALAWPERPPAAQPGR